MSYLIPSPRRHHHVTSLSAPIVLFLIATLFFASTCLCYKTSEKYPPKYYGNLVTDAAPGAVTSKGGGGGERFAGDMANGMGKDVPTCDQLRRMWLIHKRQSRRAVYTNKIATHPAFDTTYLRHPWALEGHRHNAPRSFLGPSAGARGRQGNGSKNKFRNFGYVRYFAPPNGGASPGTGKMGRPMDELTRKVLEARLQEQGPPPKPAISEPVILASPPPPPAAAQSPHHKGPFETVKEMVLEERLREAPPVVGLVEPSTFGTVLLSPPAGADSRGSKKPPEMMSAFEKLRFGVAKTKDQQQPPGAEEQDQIVVNRRSGGGGVPASTYFNEDTDEDDLVYYMMMPDEDQPQDQDYVYSPDQLSASSADEVAPHQLDYPSDQPPSSSWPSVTKRGLFYYPIRAARMRKHREEPNPASSTSAVSTSSSSSSSPDSSYSSLPRAPTSGFAFWRRQLLPQDPPIYSNMVDEVTSCPLVQDLPCTLNRHCFCKDTKDVFRCSTTTSTCQFIPLPSSMETKHFSRNSPITTSPTTSTTTTPTPTTTTPTTIYFADSFATFGSFIQGPQQQSNNNNDNFSDDGSWHSEPVDTDLLGAWEESSRLSDE